MKISVLEANDKAALVRAYNEFGKGHNIKFTQTHVGFDVGGNPRTYSAILYYEDADDNND